MAEVINVTLAAPEAAAAIKVDVIGAGPAGQNGSDGADGADGVSPTISSEAITGGHRLTIVDAGGTITVDVMDGQDGTDGTDGQDGTDGVSPTVAVSLITGGHRITITDADHPGGQTVDVMDGTDGADGTDGTDGTDGVSPKVTIATITGGHSVTITDADHPTGQTFNVMDGEDGAVLSVAGKTGAVTLDADDVAYDPTDTYASGTVGKAVSDLKSAIGDSVDIQFGGSGSAPLIWELGAINNQGNEEDNTTMVRTGFYLMRKGDSFKCSKTNLRVFYYDLDRTFKSTLYSVTADQDYVATETELVRFRAGYTASYGSYNYYNAYLTLSIKNGLLYEPYLEAYKKQSYLNDALFEIGGISVVDGAYTYPSPTNRVRTKEGVSFHLNVGDVVSFKSPVTRFCPFYSVNGGTVTQVGWQTAAYTVSTEGDYTFVLSSVQSGSEVTPSSAAEFSRTISIATSEQINDVCIWDAIGEVDNIARDAGGTETDSAITATVNLVNQAVDGNDLIFVHITDSHVGQSAMPLDRATKHFTKAMDVAKAVGADFLIHTGDMIQGNGSTVGDNDRKRYGGYMGKVGRYVTPFMWCQGNPNHDYGVTDSDSATGYALDRDIVLALTGRFGKWNTFTANFNDNDTIRSYYYFDLPVQQTRIIVLDSDDYGGNRQGWGYNAIQIAWLETVLSDASSKDLPVILFSHMPPSNNLMPNGIENLGGSGIMSALATFTSNGGTVLAFIYGHVHWDNYYNDTEHGVPYISCTCDLPVASTEVFVPTWGTKNVPARTIGSLTEYAFDVYVINPATKSTKIFRYGAGSNRSYTY